MNGMRRFAISLGLGATAVALSFALIFGGGLAWEVSRHSHDGQAGMGPFLLGVVFAPAIGVLTFVATFLRLCRR